MNVIIANERKQELSNLNIDIIKNVEGKYSADEIVSMFQDFFYAKMILDVTAIEDYTDIANIQKLSSGLDNDKLILLLPDNDSISNSAFLSKIISVGIYNFTTNMQGIEYLLGHTNQYKDVANIQKLDQPVEEESPVVSVSIGTRIIGVRNITDQAGSTSLIYMLKKELEKFYGDTIYAIEVEKHDFLYLNEKHMISVLKTDLEKTIKNLHDAKYIFIDLDADTDTSFCGDIIYLLEPSVIKLNQLLKDKPNFQEKYVGKKVVLNKCLLDNKDVNEFEYESKLNIFYTLPPVNDRESSDVIKNFLFKLGLIKEQSGSESKGLFNLFKH